MKNIFLLTLSLILCLPAAVLAQEEGEQTQKPRPVRAPFESIWLIDGQTIIVPSKGTFEWDIQHRFGRINTDVNRDSGVNLRSLWGIYSPSNIRLGFSYVPVENLMVGFGNTKNDNLIDFNVKYSILKQTRDWSTPVSVSYFGNAVVDAGQDNIFNGLQRWSFYHELMVAVRVNMNLSVQLSGNFSHFNGMEKSFYKLEGATPDTLYRNDVIGISAKARYKVGSTISLLLAYDSPVVGLYEGEGDFDYRPNISFGLEMSTSGHAFQIFAGRYYDIVPQYNYAYNGSPDASKFLIGFNMTRLWNF